MSTYVRIREGDMELMANYYQQARGLRAGNKFARDCGLTARTFYRPQLNEYRTSYIPDATLSKIIAHADKRCGLTEENFRAANGEIELGFLEGLLQYERSCRPEKTESQPTFLCSLDANGHMSVVGEGEDVLQDERPEKEDEDGFYSENYLAYVKFVAQMSQFMSRLETEAQKKYVLTKVRQLYHDEAFGYLLNQYSEYIQTEEGGMEMEGGLTDRFKEMDGNGKRAAVIFQLLKGYVLKGTCSWNTEKGIYNDEI